MQKDKIVTDIHTDSQNRLHFAKTGKGYLIIEGKLYFINSDQKYTFDGKEANLKKNEAK